MSGVTSEFAVTLGVTSYANSLAPALQYYCRQDVSCSYAPASLTDGGACAVSKFDNMTHFSENQFFLASGCNEIWIKDGSTLFGGTDCTHDETEQCPSVFYRYPSGRDQTAYCPQGTEMVITASGISGGIIYTFTPSPGVEILGDELPEGCSLVGNAYQCDPGVATLRFTNTGESTFCDVLSGGEDPCPTPSFGVAYGQCGEACEKGKDPELPSSSDSFSAILKVTSYANSLAPRLEWSCAQDIACFNTAPPELATNCFPAKFANLTEYSEHFGELATGCNEIVLEDGSGLFEGRTCDNKASVACGGVLYSYPSGRDQIASCPSGTMMQLGVTGIIGDINYIVEPTSSAVQLVGEQLPDGCDYIANGYRCKSGTVRFQFVHGAQPCNPNGDDCPFPLLGYRYGSCGAQQCSEGPNIIPPEAGDEFQVTLGVTSYANSLAPGLEWYCRHSLSCSYLPDSLTETCTANSNFGTLSDYFESDVSLLDSGCNQIVLEDASGLFDGNSCTSTEKCGAVLMRYRSGRDQAAVCPTGSELVITANGIPGDIDYIFNPGLGTQLMGALPPGCVFVAGNYRCEPGRVQLRFAHLEDPCDSTGRCSTPGTGRAYGICTTTEDGCYTNIPVSELPITTFQPTTSMALSTSGPTALATTPVPTTSPPSPDPTSSPSRTPTESPSRNPTLAPSGPPTFAPSRTPTAAPSGAPTSAPSIVIFSHVVTQETNVDTPVTVVITAEDIFDDGQGSSGTLDNNTLEVINPPLNGNVTIADKASITYAPYEGFQGKDEFVMRACDTGGTCAAITMQVAVVPQPTVAATEDGKSNLDALYALIALILAPVLWFFQEPLKRCYDRCFTSNKDNDGADTTTAVPTSVHVDPTSQHSDSNPVADDEDGSSPGAFPGADVDGLNGSDESDGGDSASDNTEDLFNDSNGVGDDEDDDSSPAEEGVPDDSSENTEDYFDNV